jgi:hypothetical protein
LNSKALRFARNDHQSKATSDALREKETFAATGFSITRACCISDHDEEDHMDKVLEFLDAWVKAQKEFMENWVRSQKEFIEKWLEATKKMQESFLSMGGSREGTTQETLNLYRSWLTTMENSAKAYADEAGKIQETWKDTIGKQMEMSREMAKNMTDLFKQAAEKK